MLLWDLLGKFPGTDYESFNYEWIIGKLKELKDSVVNAKASEDAAAESAEHAAGSAGLALLYRNAAKDYRDEAQGFANDAQDSAESIAHISDQVAVNTGRIDSLIANAGDGTIPSELIDIRTAANGVVYPTAGDAVRGQVDMLLTGIDAIDYSFDEQVGNRLLNYDPVIVNDDHRLGVDGQLVSDVGYSYTDYYPITPNTAVLLNWAPTWQRRICEYDALHNFVADHSDSAKTFTTNQNTRYIRYNGLTTEIESFRMLTPVVMNPNMINAAVNTIIQPNVFDGTTYENGYYTNDGRLISSSTYKHTTIPVTPGDTVRWTYEDADLHNQNGIIVDSENVLIASCASLQTRVDMTYYELTVPSNAAAIWLNFRNAGNLKVIINSEYNADAVYNKVTMPSLDISQNLDESNIQVKNAVNYATTYKKIACIGDSLTVGYYGDAGGVNYGTYPDYNYPAFLARLLDADVTNLGLSGRSAQTWFEQYQAQFPADARTWTNYDAVIIFLGTNGGLSGEVSADSANTSQMGYYCRIIEAIRTASPNTQIFLCTSGWTQNREANPFTTEVMNCGAAYELPVLRLDQSELLTYAERMINQPYDHVLHYGRTGLMRMASEIIRCINEQDPAVFNSLYGTHY